MLYNLEGFKPKDPEPELHVYLEENFDRRVSLMVKDKDGIPWYIASLTKEGTLLLHKNVPEHLKLKLQDDGCIKTVKV